MPDRRRNLAFTEKSRPLFWTKSRPPQDFQGNSATGREVGRFVDLAHPASAEQPTDFVVASSRAFPHPVGLAAVGFGGRLRVVLVGAHCIQAGTQQTARAEAFGRIGREYSA